MTELARNDFRTPAAFEPATLRTARITGNDQFERMGKWLELFMSTAEVAQVLARTAFVPEPMRGQPENIAAAMMKSLELGIDPLDGLSSIHVVKGKIGFSAEFMRRRILEAGHEFVIDESTDDRCKMRGRRAGSTEWQTAVFTADQARKAKIVLGDYPADKLVARASSRLCRRVFPDVLAGANIIDDLLDDDTEETPATGAAVRRKRAPRAVKASDEPKPQPVADVDDLLDDAPAEPEPSEPESAPDEDEITKPQLQKLSILRQTNGYADTDEGRADWFQWVETNIGRTVGTNKDLTKAEASVLIDVLETSGGNS